jgi:hypothetical protein
MAGILKVDQVQSDSNLAFAIAGSNVAFMNATSLQMVGSNVSLAGTNVITNGKLVTAAQPTGAVLQVVSQQNPQTIQTTSNPFTMLTQSFTPTSATSKVLALMSFTTERNGGGAGNYLFINFNRNGSTIVAPYAWGNAPGYQANNGDRHVGTHTYLDSPATTSAISYTIVGDFSVSGNVPWIFYTLQLTLMEIAA